MEIYTDCKITLITLTLEQAVSKYILQLAAADITDCKIDYVQLSTLYCAPKCCN